MEMDEINTESEVVTPWKLVAQGNGWSVRSFEAGWTVRIRGGDLMVLDIIHFVPIWDQGREGSRQYLLSQALTDDHKARITECMDADWSGLDQNF